MKAKGCTNQQLADYFSLSLKSRALKWFFRLQPEARATWEQITSTFTDKYKANLEWETNRVDLQTTMQRPNENIGDFYKRWNLKLSEMAIPPSDEEQLDIFQSCLKPHLRASLSHFPYADLRAMVNSGAKFEKAYNQQPTAALAYGYRAPPSNTTLAFTKGKEAIGYAGQDCNNATSFVPKKPDASRSRLQDLRNLGMPLSDIFRGLVKEGLLRPLDNYQPRNPNAPLDTSKHCAFHQYHGHLTDDCVPLKKAIQNLIEQGRLEMPEGPNTINNPLPNNMSVNMVEFGDPRLVGIMEFDSPLCEVGESAIAGDESGWIKKEIAKEILMERSAIAPVSSVEE